MAEIDLEGIGFSMLVEIKSNGERHELSPVELDEIGSGIDMRLIRRSYEN